jgi:hypothetical protein
MAKATEVAKTELVSEQLPDFLKSEKAGQGTEALSANALSPPRFKMAQALSPELEELPELRPGMFFNSNSGAIYGSVVRIIPCFMTEAYFLFAPRLPGVTGGLLARANDGMHWSPPNATFEVVIDKSGRKVTWKTADTVARSGLANWGTMDPADQNSKPAAVHAINCVVLTAADLEAGPSVLSFSRSALKQGKKMAGNLSMSRIPSFGRVFELSSMKVDGPSGPYFEPRFKPVGFVADAKIFNMAKDVYEAAKALGVEVDLGPDMAESEPGAGRMSTGGDTGIGTDKIPY